MSKLNLIVAAVVVLMACAAFSPAQATAAHGSKKPDTDDLVKQIEDLLKKLKKNLQDAKDHLEKGAKELAAKAIEEVKAGIKLIRATIAGMGKFTDKIEKILKELQEEGKKIMNDIADKS